MGGTGTALTSQADHAGSVPKRSDFNTEGGRGARCATETLAVVAGLDPAIYVFSQQRSA